MITIEETLSQNREERTKKMTKKEIPIKETISYKGPDMKWTEEYTGNVVLPAGTELFHASDGEINAFHPKLTCFTREMIQSGEIYKLVVKEDIIGQAYSSGEVRIDLGKYRNMVVIYHIGELVQKTSFVEERQFSWQRSEIWQGREVYRKVEKIFYPVKGENE
jgi:hypothetical protein